MADIGTKNNDADLALRSIKSTFETGEVKRMYDISTLYPTKIIKALGLNHGRYVNKLAKPEKFSIEEIIRFSRLIGVDHNKVLEVILREALPNVIANEQEKMSKVKKTAKKSTSTKVNTPKSSKKQ